MSILRGPESRPILFGFASSIMLTSNRLELAVALIVLAAARVLANCDACIAGSCHTHRSLLAGLPITDQLTIDRPHNVLYLQILSHVNIAFHLDDNHIELVNLIKTSGMAIDEKTSTLYLGTKEYKNTYFMCNLETNVTQTIFTEDYGRKPDKMFYGEESIFFIDAKFSGLHLYNTTNKEVWQVKYLEEYTITDFVIDDDLKIFFITNKTLYMFHYKANMDPDPPKVMARKRNIVAVDKYDDEIFAAHAYERVIYRYNKANDMLEIYASYKTSMIQDFVFDNSNGIVYRDDGGSVSQWILSTAQMRCAVMPPRVGFQIQVLPDYDDVYNNQLKLYNIHNSTKGRGLNILI